jgi:hypothetical protein
MMSLLNLSVLSLAVWRISSLFVEERGAFDIFLRIRRIAGIIHDSNHEPTEWPDKFFPNLLSCVRCASMWVSIGLFFFWLFTPNIAIYFAIPFALSTLAILIDNYV